MKSETLKIVLKRNFIVNKEKKARSAVFICYLLYIKSIHYSYPLKIAKSLLFLVDRSRLSSTAAVSRVEDADSEKSYFIFHLFRFISFISSRV